MELRPYLLLAMLGPIAASPAAAVAASPTAEGVEFFEKRIRPIFVEHCDRCHSANADELRGDLRLDLRAGWEHGGESGQPAIVPGAPEESPLILAVRHAADASPMPPDAPRLPSQAIADLTTWVEMGAPDPREGSLEVRDKQADWEAAYQSRLGWWSLQPIASPPLPYVAEGDWRSNEVDPFVLASLDGHGLQPAPPADRRTLARRLSFALLGLPPDPSAVERFVADPSPNAYERLVDQWLESPHFGERWARHWMDVVHYADTHGYEWDVPTKNSWRYRDYLIRAFNADVPYRQLVLEYLAGDLIPPRIDAATGVNEALIGPLALRLGERRHGDNADHEGITQEALANMIDTLGKALLGTTLACAQCHDHKLDAVEQRDYYALAGTLMSTRFSSRTIERGDENARIIDRLRPIKQQLRAELATLWLKAAGDVASKLRAIPADEKLAEAFPQSLAEFWQRSRIAPLASADFARERTKRIGDNAANLTLLADMTRDEGARGWRWDGLGMFYGLVNDGEPVVAGEGNAVLQHLLPAGRWTHVWSQRLAGSLQSPLLDTTTPQGLSLEVAGGGLAGESFIVDRALFSEKMTFVDRPLPAWNTLTAGGFTTLEGSIDSAKRLVYFELATKSLNNNFPPRSGFGGVQASDEVDPRSWFGVSRVYQHAIGKPPQDELGRFAPLFESLAATGDWADRLAQLVHGAVRRWAAEECDREDVRLLNDALLMGLLPNDVASDPEIAALTALYRSIADKIQPDQTVGSVVEWNEGEDQRIGVRGSYTEFGDQVERGALRFLGGSLPRQNVASSGRLELALRIVDEKNPLTARVYVNRVWHYLFGAGLVRTPDDFGHLGERPTHPELLDYLATRFVREGWSTKKLIALLVKSSTWRQSGLVSAHARAVDPDNLFWHHMPLRRLEAEAIRDALLAVSGRWDQTLYGPAIEPFRAAEDPKKRLFCGPLDGLGRRSLYIEMTLMEPPRFLALFNQPLPKQTVGRRESSNVPDQALALLNDPFVIEMAKVWSGRVLADAALTPTSRAAQMLTAALARPPKNEEVDRLVALVQQSASLHGAPQEGLMECQPVWQDVAHAIFNMKEFIYLP